jgi:hypothetical protein
MDTQLDSALSGIKNRRVAWTPPARPDWVARINDEGRHLDIKAVVPLDSASLIETAIANTGLTNFGTDDWREPFELVCRGLDTEAELNLMGRIMTRADMLMQLQGRLQVEDAYLQHPEIEDQQITAPILVVGQGRSGTSAMINLLAADPANAVVRTWQALLPGVAETDANAAALIQQADQHMRMWGRVTPEIDAMHEFTGEVPTENIQFENLSFMSPSWQALLGQNPSHYIHMATRSRVPCFAYGKRFLKLLQWRNPGKTWMLKSPDALNYLPDFLAVYPDAGLVFMHRDPVKSLSSMISLVGTLAWIRSDQVLAEGTFREVTDAKVCADMLMKPVEAIEAGLLPAGRLHNVHYQDFVTDPLQTVAGIYSNFGIPFTPDRHAAIAGYIKAHPRTARPAHRYDTGDDQLVTAERAAFARYQAHFNVPSEI